MVTRLWRAFRWTMGAVSTMSGYFTGALIVLSATLVTYEVIWRYYLVEPHTWSLEVNIFMLIGATFLAASFTQLKLGHVGPELLNLVLPKQWLLWRVLIVRDLSSLVCGFSGTIMAYYST